MLFRYTIKLNVNSGISEHHYHSFNALSKGDTGAIRTCDIKMAIRNLYVLVIRIYESSETCTVAIRAEKLKNSIRDQINVHIH